MSRSSEQVRRDLATVLATTFPDRDLPADPGPDTRLLADLGLTSIELVVLGERLEQYYGKRLPFGPFLAALRAKGADDLELGELVRFVSEHT